MMQPSPLEEKIQAIIGKSLTAMGYVIVLIRLADGGKRKLLSITAERADGKPMTVDDCAEISHTASALLDVEDPISGAYQLEVASPGLERPLVKLEDFERYKGHEAKIELNFPLEGRKRFKGEITGVKGEEVTIKMEKESVVLPFAQMRSARLVLTDALMREYLKSS